MSKAIKFSDNVYLDSDSVAFKKQKLTDILTYSQQEQLIGKWTDGRNLYRKVLTFNDSVSNSQSNTFPHNISNARFIMIKNAFLYSPSDGITYSLPITLYGSNSYEDKLSIRADRTNITFFVATGWSAGWYKVVILEYTKNTD